MAKAMRHAVAALRFVAQFTLRSSGSMHAGECLGVMFRAPFRFATAKGFAEKGLPSMHSNNPLAVELESENDATCEIYPNLFRHSFRFEAAAFGRANDRDFFK